VVGSLATVEATVAAAATETVVAEAAVTDSEVGNHPAH